MTTSTKFCVDYAKRVAGCKKCKQQLPKGALRMARLIPSPFSSDTSNPTEMKQYFHAECLFETLTRCRPTTKVIESSDDIAGWSDVEDEDKNKISALIEKLTELRSGSSEKTAKKVKKSSSEKNEKNDIDSNKRKRRSSESKSGSSASSSKKPKTGNSSKGNVEETPKKRRKKVDCGENSREDPSPSVSSKFDSFKVFCKLCDIISSVSKYTEKSNAVRLFITKEGYDGDLYLLAKLLIPSADHRVYNLKEKQLIKHFAYLFDWSVDELTEHFNNSGDLSVTIRNYFEKTSSSLANKSTLTNQDVDRWLDELTKFTKEDDQQKHLLKITKKTTPVELQYVLRLIKKDLRFNAGAKHILEGIETGAYEMFQNSRDLKAVIEKCLPRNPASSIVTLSGISLGTPVKPMLAKPCRSVEEAMGTCKNGMLCEIKYDGERLQLHKEGGKFTFYSRSLKSVQEHKVSHFSSFIPKAFPSGGDMILDSEVLMVDITTGKPLPFGTLGIHKKEQFKDAVVCLFVFDCLLYDGISLMDRPIKERRRLLEENINEIPNRVLLSNYQLINHGEHHRLRTMIWKAIDEGLEGLVLKDVDSVYEPGMRHWLKMKKDYLEDGRMADTADLLVLGAYYGTGSKGGMMSVFLMGVYDPSTKMYLTVTKCGNGHDDATLNKINKELGTKMRKISCKYENLPKWLSCARSLVPDFVIRDPKESPVWEISGAEFSKSNRHTADGISIRFPRVTRIREDKTWETATNLQELKQLYEVSKTKCDFDLSDDDSRPLFTKQSHLTHSTTMKVGNGKTGESKDEVNYEKRKESTNSDDDPGPLTKTGTVDDLQRKHVSKPPCKYGSKCYRKNEEHLQKYSH
ncbi:hypothetical protein AB6A40_001838 [Gnathostoma spinigerum]|uniref:DNA ligase 3 n=1 Tax=Gnathostoma spinigerum TaxID=75299 RepID=A0ABD6EAH1_9BILA